jgi:hypothetical protein
MDQECRNFIFGLSCDLLIDKEEKKWPDFGTVTRSRFSFIKEHLFHEIFSLKAVISIFANKFAAFPHTDDSRHSSNRFYDSDNNIAAPSSKH